MSIITGMRLVSGLTAGTINAAELTGLISTPAGAAGWKAAISSSALSQQLVQEPTARAAWMGSAAAVNIAVKARSFVRLWMSHPEALDSLMATTSSVAALLDSREARIALWSHDQGLIAMGLSATAYAAAKASNKLKQSGGIVAASPSLVIPGGGRFILVSTISNATASMATQSKRPGSAIPSVVPVAPVERPVVIPLIGPVSCSAVNSGGISVTVTYLPAD